jgi:cobalt-precorrin-5B (C1)-methyltransferase
MALLDMGDFAGGTFKYLRRHPVPRLTVAGGFAKLAKLAQGHLDLHSSRSELDQGALAKLVVERGAPPTLVQAMATANTASQMLTQARDVAFPLADIVADMARRAAREVVGAGVAVEVLVVDRQGDVAGRAAGW